MLNSTNNVSLTKKDRQQGSAFDISVDRELLRMPAMKGKIIVAYTVDNKNLIMKCNIIKYCASILSSL